MQKQLSPDRIWISLIVIILVIVIMRTSWISDDAYITFRSIENFINGYGPTYNIGERVQTYTHPLWMLILSISYFVCFRVFNLNIPAELPLIALLWSWVFVLLSIGIIIYNRKVNGLALGFGVWILIASKAFIDFATSGLENPLTYTLIGIFFYTFDKIFSSDADRSNKQILALSFIAGFATLNRMDTVFIFLPALALAWYSTKERMKGFLLILAGFSPFILWELFSLLYYGFLIPNTAYAKLNSGIASWAYVKQGFWYLANSIVLDPISIPLILTAGLLGLIAWDRRITPASVGLFLYLGYIVRIGGDYMSGRFLSSLVFLAVVILLNLDIQWNQIALPAILSIFLLGVISNSLPYTSDSSYENQSIDRNAIADERGFRYQDWGLLRISKNRLLPDSPYAHGRWVFEGTSDVRVSGAIGLEGYLLGPNVHILDIMALTDPFLARLPAIDQQHWRVGHIERKIPEGYKETLITNQNSIEDPNLKAYYDNLSIITQNSIWDFERLKTILKFQLGLYDTYLDAWHEMSS